MSAGGADLANSQLTASWGASNSAAHAQHPAPQIHLPGLKKLKSFFELGSPGPLLSCPHLPDEIKGVGGGGGEKTRRLSPPPARTIQTWFL